MKTLFKQVVQWSIAAVIALIICNGLLFFYHRPPGWIDRTNSSTSAIWRPGSTLLMGTEGAGYHHVDQRGYINDELPLQDKYCLIVGSSYTQGKEVNSGKRFTDLLNQRLADSEDKLAVYNCSKDANYFPQIINDFYAITQEFPNAATIVIEINTTDYTVDELKESLNQHKFDEKQLGTNIMKSLSTKDRLKMSVKEMLPIYTIIKKQFQMMSDVSEASKVKINADPVAENIDVDSKVEEQQHYIDEALSLIRKEFDGNLIIMYHPQVFLDESGMLQIKEELSTEKFSELCHKNNIVFADVSNAFITAYESDYVVPYGFSDTTKAKGHLNSDGHQIVADELYPLLKGDKDK